MCVCVCVLGILNRRRVYSSQAIEAENSGVARDWGGGNGDLFNGYKVTATQDK